MSDNTNEHTQLRGLLLVGSLPLPTVEDVFRQAGGTIGPWLSSLPDGEVGERLSWTGYMADHVYENCEALERVSKPDYDNQVHAPEHEHHWDISKLDISAFDTFRIKEGADSVTLGDLYVGGVAIDSYKRFRALRDEGVIPEHVRFQVCLPGTTSAVDEFFVDPADLPTMSEAYRDALIREIDIILDGIPREDLAIQFDCAWEILDLSLGGDAPMLPWAPTLTLDEKLSKHVDGLTTLIDAVPDGILVGVHWCYGTWGGWPMNEMTDLSLCVDLTLRTLEAAERRIDYVHMPVTDDADSDFFASLSKLRDVDCKVYLGLLHHTDDAASVQQRWALAREYLGDAGIAGACGFGRLSPEVVPDVLRLHREAGEMLDRATSA